MSKLMDLLMSLDEKEFKEAWEEMQMLTDPMTVALMKELVK